MPDRSNSLIAEPPSERSRTWRNALTAAASLFVFLLGVRGLGVGFHLLGAGLLDSFFAATSNPLTALMVGLLATTLVQSSSVSTSMIVGLVAAPDHPLPLANAVPMVMGANIGTTVTNTIVSLAHMGRRDEFRRAFATATCHDFFNYFAVILLLPLELATGFLSRSAAALGGWIGSEPAVSVESPLAGVLKAAFEPVLLVIETLFPSSPEIQGAAAALLSGALIVGALLTLVRTMRTLIERRVERVIERYLGRGLPAILAGAAATVAVQSSSITTSLLVPLAGAGVLTLRQAFPVTLGANIGTTVTGLLASLGVAGVNARHGVTIALVHLLFNLTATLLIYPVPSLRRLPLLAAERLAGVAVHSKSAAIAYIVFLFYVLPGLFAWLAR